MVPHAVDQLRNVPISASCCATCSARCGFGMSRWGLLCSSGTMRPW
jgi:hypothetical protein